ncbi:MAG: TonB-dependent receptor plug domain-containing protein, partial [Pseudomonadota bacterium]
MHRNTLYLSTALVAAGCAVSAQDIDFDLGTIELNSAFRDDRPLLDTPVSASVVEGERLARRQASDFQGLIGDVPGVSIGGGPRAIAQEPNIRGFTDDQIVLRFDGGRFNFNQAHRGRFFLDPDIVQRVEVIRGGGSTLYGSGALGGVISVETKDAADLLAPGQTVGGRLRFGYGTNGSEPSVSGTAFADWGKVDALVFLGSRQLNDDLVSGNGAIIPFSEFDQFTGLFKIGFEPTDEMR